ncbi:MAG: hypothetical protein GTO45_32175 [Candidatus Aminicenantes bacterium]|nr:hypothetical protein [Candidatus Aminicenantes bacterium]NIM83424.1 hypothetical protein [Candidatus Aminicenantes bacterium]NIN22799.1 hypothetical protein [Candidatus Aminicenantes bacterium]NIN46533.1 hypothetical protein [Candidatus Aminicenantes bacterium]NIN89438.1 hypothetical protein [Candidatus Aminicenantes bacterium]
MKIKKFEKKLVLSKKTIAHLTNEDMHSLFAGITGTCDTCGETGFM